MERSAVYVAARPILIELQALGLLPISRSGGKLTSRLASIPTIYCAFIFLATAITAIYSYRLNMGPKQAEGRFEEAVMEHLFGVYLVPAGLAPVMWIEAPKLCRVLVQWVDWEIKFGQVTNGKVVEIGSSALPLLLALGAATAGAGSMIAALATMSRLHWIRALPYCVAGTVPYALAALWWIQCIGLQAAATTLSEEFGRYLRSGPASANVLAAYRSLWQRLGRLERDTAGGLAYSISLLVLYLFLVATLAVYGLLSQLQTGLGSKDAALGLAAAAAVALLFVLCDRAHQAASAVRTSFQGKLLSAGLAWLNDDARAELDMFLRAVDVSRTDLSLAGFFSVDRSLFKSLLATMVTYLVVLLQFQISLPEDQ